MLLVFWETLRNVQRELVLFGEAMNIIWRLVNDEEEKASVSRGGSMISSLSVAYVGNAVGHA